MNENTWKQSARAWWQRLNEERAKNAELLQSLKQERETYERQIELIKAEADRECDDLRARISLLFEDIEYQDERNRETELRRDELLQKLKELRAELREKGAQVFRLTQRLDEHERAHLRSPELLPTRKEPQPSGIPGDFAALAERIAYADGKHPRDLEDAEFMTETATLLRSARRRLASVPTWENALNCELAEAKNAIDWGDRKEAADELLDVATVAMRWRRAVLERGKK